MMTGLYQFFLAQSILAAIGSSPVFDACLHSLGRFVFLPQARRRLRHQYWHGEALDALLRAVPIHINHYITKVVFNKKLHLFHPNVRSSLPSPVALRFNIGRRV